jgi:hypothetical protein
MAEDSSRADKRCWTVSDLAASQPVTVSHGLLAGATGVISLIPGSRERALKVSDWPEGVYVIVVNEATRLEPA